MTKKLKNDNNRLIKGKVKKERYMGHKKVT